MFSTCHLEPNFAITFQFMLDSYILFHVASSSKIPCEFQGANKVPMLGHWDQIKQQSDGKCEQKLNNLWTLKFYLPAHWCSKKHVAIAVFSSCIMEMPPNFARCLLTMPFNSKMRNHQLHLIENLFSGSLLTKRNKLRATTLLSCRQMVRHALQNLQVQEKPWSQMTHGHALTKTIRWTKEALKWSHQAVSCFSEAHRAWVCQACNHLTKTDTGQHSGRSPLLIEFTCIHKYMYCLQNRFRWICKMHKKIDCVHDMHFILCIMHYMASVIIQISYKA